MQRCPFLSTELGHCGSVHSRGLKRTKKTKKLQSNDAEKKNSRVVFDEMCGETI